MAGLHNMNPIKDLPTMRRPERAHFFSQREQELIMKLYEEERAILTAKSNTTNASRLREEAWQRIASKINAVSDSGYRRSWQQVKVKYKNIVQTARRRQAELARSGGSATPSITSADDDILLHRDSLKLDALAGLPSLDQISGSDSSFMSMPGHPVLLMPVTKTEPESLSSDETDTSEHHFESKSVPISHFEERPNTAEATGGGSGGETQQTEDVKFLYSSYLKKEMENRDQEMAYRALKMKKLEKEILLLDKQLM